MQRRLAAGAIASGLAMVCVLVGGPSAAAPAPPAQQAPSELTFLAAGPAPGFVRPDGAVSFLLWERVAPGGAIIVDREGKRWINEGTDYNTFGHLMLGTRNGTRSAKDGNRQALGRPNAVWFRP